MPYLDSKIETNKHKKDCVNPVGKRLYIRDYDDKGKQRFVPWGLTCTSCGVIVKDENYQPGLTLNELRYVEDEDMLKFKRDRKTRNKLKRLQRKGHPPITAGERSLRMRLYKFEGYRDVCLGQGRGYKPNALCEKFLSLNPRPTMQELRQALCPLGWDPHKHRNCVPDSENPGYLKYDSGRWKKDPKTGEFYKWNDDPNFVSDYEKLLKEESLKRREFMKKVITSRGEKVPKVKTEKEWQDARNEGLAKLMGEYGISVQ